jgi:hypothetical protein
MASFKPAVLMASNIKSATFAIQPKRFLEQDCHEKPSRNKFI